MGVVHYSEEARLDADNIKEYLLALGMDENKAEDFVDEIIDYADSLASFPERGAPLSARIHLATDIRYLISNGYFIFYRVENDNVFVSRILSEKMNYMKVLFSRTGSTINN